MVTDHTLYCKAIPLAIWHICPNLAASPDHCSFPSKSIREIWVQKKLKWKNFWMGAIHFIFLERALAWFEPQTDKERLLFCQKEQESRSWKIQTTLSWHNVPVETCNLLLPLACTSVWLSPLPSPCMSAPAGDRVPARGGGGAAHRSVHHSLQSDGAGGERSHHREPSAGVSVYSTHHFFSFPFLGQTSVLTFGNKRADNN